MRQAYAETQGEEDVLPRLFRVSRVLADRVSEMNRAQCEFLADKSDLPAMLLAAAGVWAFIDEAES